MKRFEAHYDQSYVYPGGAATRRLIIDLEAEELPALTEPAPPISLALVLDVSGSMTGARLEAAKSAAISVVRGLDEADRLTLVTFDDDIRVAIEDLPLDLAGEERAVEAILRLQTGGMTNLSGGWLAAGSLLAANAGLHPRRRYQIVLLSDGRANRGVLEPVLLAEEAAELQARGIATTCVGIGDDYSSLQLEAIAEHGGGRLHDAEFAEEIGVVLVGEVRGLDTITAEGAAVEVELPEGVAARDLAGGPTVTEGRIFACRLGGLRAGCPRTLVLELRFPELDAGDVELPVRLSWSEPGTGERRSLETRPVLHCQSFPTPPPPSLQDRRVVVRYWELGLLRSVTALNRDGAFDEIGSLERSEFESLRKLAGKDPAAHESVMRLRHFFHQSRRPMRERMRKDICCSVQQRSKGEADHRPGRNRSLETHLGNPASRQRRS